MPIVSSFSRRPLFATAALAAVIVIGALVVPVSWERTVGHDVTLALGQVQDPARVADIAREMKSVLEADHVTARAEQGGSSAAITLEAYVPSKVVSDPGPRIEALAHALLARGFDAHAASTPRRERVAGSVYAYARDLVIKVDTSGKNAAQIESEIKQRLAEAGITNTTVSVTQSGREEKVMVKAESHDPNATPENVQLQLTKDGQPLSVADGIQVQVRRIKSPSGIALHFQVAQQGRTTEFNIPNANTLSDAQLQAAVAAKLQAAGIDATVRVTNGQVEIDARK